MAAFSMVDAWLRWMSEIGGVMTIKIGKEQLLRSIWEEVNAVGVDALQRLLAEHYIRHGSDRDYSREEWLALMNERHLAFPDNKTSIDQVVVDGDMVAYRWTAVGTHQGVYMGVPATGKTVEVQGITITRFEDGLVCEEWASWDKSAVMRTLGIHSLL
jgi:steroid delta-isomerase-like uncharacterized protein